MSDLPETSSLFAPSVDIDIEIGDPEKEDVGETTLEAAFSVTVGAFLQQQQLLKPIVIDGDMPPLAAFQILLENHILSAPVTEGKDYCGFLDIKDLVASLLFVEENNHTEGKHGADLYSHSLQNDANIKRYGNPVQGITTRYLARRNPFVPVSLNDKLGKITALLSQRQIHRVPVMGPDGLVAIISQSAIIQYINSKSKQLAADPFMQQVGRASHPVFTVAVAVTALEAFHKIQEKNISGIAVVDEEGKLLTCTSASDIKLLLQYHSPGILHKNIMDFLGEVRKHDKNSRASAVTVSDKATIAKAIAKLAATKLHRIFTTDSAGRPSGSLSLRDICSQIVETYPAIVEGDSSPNIEAVEI